MQAPRGHWLFFARDFLRDLVPALREALARIPARDSQKFVTYLHARRALERWSKGKNPGMTQEDAAYLKGKLETPAFIDAATKWYAWWDGVLDVVRQAQQQLGAAGIVVIAVIALLLSGSP